MVLAKTLESPLDCKKMQPVHSEGAKESWGLLSSDCRANRPHLGLCPEANVPLQAKGAFFLNSFTSQTTTKLFRERVSLTSIYVNTGRIERDGVESENQIWLI